MSTATYRRALAAFLADHAHLTRADDLIAASDLVLTLRGAIEEMDVSNGDELHALMALHDELHEAVEAVREGYPVAGLAGVVERCRAHLRAYPIEVPWEAQRAALVAGLAGARTPLTAARRRDDCPLSEDVVNDLEYAVEIAADPAAYGDAVAALRSQVRVLRHLLDGRNSWSPAQRLMVTAYADAVEGLVEEHG